MNKFKVVHVSDLHFGLSTFGVDNPETSLNTRTEDIFRAFSQCVDYCINNKVKICIISGDIFHTKTPSQQVVNEYYKYIQQLSANDVFVYVLFGNHDIAKQQSKRCALDIPKTLNITNVFSTKGDDDILNLGYIQLYSPNYWDTDEILFNKINNAINNLQSNIPAILIAHLQTETSNFKIGGAFEDLHIVPLEYLTSLSWSYVALGHVHQYEKLHDNPPVYYASSLARTSFAEEFDNKGFNVITFENNKVTNIERIPVNCLKMFTIKGTPKEIFNQLENKSTEDFKNTIVRVISDETSNQTTDEKFLKDIFSKSFKYILKKENNKIQHNQIDTTNLLDIKEYAKKYFENHKRKDDLLNMIEEFRLKDEEKNIV